MIKTDDQAIAVLNTLLPVCRDSHRGYEAAAGDVKDPELARTLGEYATQRREFAEELRDRLKALRVEPDDRGTVGGVVHRAWMDSRATREGAPIHAVLDECERADDLAVMAYREALRARDIDQQTRNVIQRQYELVQAAHDRVKQLRDSPANANR